MPLLNLPEVMSILTPPSWETVLRVLVSDMSGRSSIMMKAKEMGMEVDGRSPEMKSFLEELKQLEFKGYEYESMTRLSIFYSKISSWKNFVFEVLRYHVGVGSGSEAKTSSSEATVKLKIDNEIRHTVAEGNGPFPLLIMLWSRHWKRFS